MSLSVIILAAGQGTRMRSSLPKVLHPVGGSPMLQHVLNTAHGLEAEAIHVVYGHGGEQVLGSIHDESVVWVLQEEQLGTGHAVEQAMPGIADDHTVLILYGDVPLTRVETLRPLIEAAADGVALLTVELDPPTGYGRILRDDKGAVRAIIEEKDASETQQAITEVNTGMMAAPAGKLRRWLEALENNNAQGEYYLTDIIASAVADGVAVNAVRAASVIEVSGVNNRAQLAQMERAWQRRQAEAAMAAGATLLDPARFDVRGELVVGEDVTIDVNCVFEGRVVIGKRVHIGPNCFIRDAEIADDVTLLANTVIEEARVGAGSRVGPFSRLRPGAELAGDNHIGNFVEIKNSAIGEGSKVNHLSYIGDTSMGEGVNIGAGTITANYDGANKHRTTIEDQASTGSNSVLIAPVKVGKGATLGAATVLRKDAPEGQLTLTPTKQKSLEGWKRPEKKK
ncbi:MAG: bifunctional UDP-N-acetylglucosamine diphosphorylase/glucosamine-1-phosphate N-acetyltransferase GlmU [Gammaproteobacteria bacterium]|nr:bifunctional UDP-N-acetylglucosamine diphosphorylase/glucosamine-1-phosphate N-acetyltransferase GlmU [Gammaproteobacteria bacterium]